MVRFKLLKNYIPSCISLKSIPLFYCITVGYPCIRREDRKAFLFSLYNINGHHPVNFTVKYNNAIYSCRQQLPIFGYAADLFFKPLPLTSFAKPDTYQIPPGCVEEQKCNFYTGTVDFHLTDMEVFSRTKEG